MRDEPRGQQRPFHKDLFPRIILPAAAAFSNLVDFLISSVFLVGFIVYYEIPLGWNLLLWPVLVALLMLLALGLGAFFAALNVKYRDIKYALTLFHSAVAICYADYLSCKV